MKAIVNVNKDWAIGRDGELFVNIPEDMRFFRSSTAGKTVVMGRKTLESFPGKKPLKGRINIVLTRNAANIPRESLEAADTVFPVPDKAVLSELKAIQKHNASCEAAERKTVLAVAGSAEGFLEFLKDEYEAETMKADAEAAASTVLETCENSGDHAAFAAAESIVGSVTPCVETAAGAACAPGAPGEAFADSIFVIGGEQIYREFLPYCSECLVTVNDKQGEADAFFPNLDQNASWELSSEGEEKEFEGIHYRFNTYRNIAYDET